MTAGGLYKKTPDADQGYLMNSPAMPCEPRCLNLQMQVGALTRVSAWPDGRNRELLHPLSVFVTPICEALAQHWQAHHAHSRVAEILTQSQGDDKVVHCFTMPFIIEKNATISGHFAQKWQPKNQER